MDGKSTNRRDWMIGELADRRHGVVGRTLLLAAGLSSESVDNAIAAGRLRPLFRGVYAVGHRALSDNGWCQAALLACGDDSVLSHGTAAHLWRLRPAELFPLWTIVPGSRGRKQDRIEARRMRLDRSEWMTLDGLRLTTPARTVVDMAGELSPREMRRLVERAQDLNRFDPTGIEAVLHRNQRRPGCRPLRDLIALLRPDQDGAKSHLERLFLKLIRNAGLPLPEVNVRIEGRERDFLWREERLVVEVDGYAFHSSRRAMRRDRARDRHLTAALWRPARYSYEEVAFEPVATAADLRSLL